MIADLNAYHNFIASLKVRLSRHTLRVSFLTNIHMQVPSITADFSNLKMLGHVYVVEDAKDLAQIVRDVTRYGGAYRPEVRFACLIAHQYVLKLTCCRLQDIYEFIQRRADWKKIEKTVDKTMYNLSFKEDCIIC